MKSIRILCQNLSSRYGIGSTFDYECMRLLLSYTLSISGSTTKEIIGDIYALSAILNEKNDLSIIEHNNTSSPAPQLLPNTGNNLKIYKKQFREIQPYLTDTPSSDGNPFSSFLYVICPNMGFRGLSIPVKIEDYIVKRTPKKGRIVHPSLAYDDDFLALSAGEYSIIENSRYKKKILFINTCSGHYTPKSLTPNTLHQTLRSTLKNYDDYLMILLTTNGCAFSAELMEDNYESYRANFIL